MTLSLLPSVDVHEDGSLTPAAPQRQLLFTLRLTISRGEILAEPFLFIGLIAVVRRVLVITAESEGAAVGGRTLTNFLLELGVLAVLALALAAAIHMLRRSSASPGHVLPPAVRPLA